jgi:hypothetical protein
METNCIFFEVGTAILSMSMNFMFQTVTDANLYIRITFLWTALLRVGEELSALPYPQMRRDSYKMTTVKFTCVHKTVL